MSVAPEGIRESSVRRRLEGRGAGWEGEGEARRGMGGRGGGEGWEEEGEEGGQKREGEE